MAIKKSKKKSGSRPARHAIPSTDDAVRLAAGSEPDIDALLRSAVAADPTTRKGKAALSAAESAALRLARGLKRRAQEIGGTFGADLAERANDAYFRAVIAQLLPELIEAMQRPPLPVAPLEAAPVPALPVAPSAPANVQATAATLSAIVRWEQAPGDLVTTFTVTPKIAGASQLPTTVGGTLRQTVILGLTAGTTYTFSVTAANTVGSATSGDSNPVVPLAVTVPPAGSGPLDLRLPRFSSDPALIIDRKAIDPLRPFIADAARIGQKWRYEYLKLQAIAAAKDAMTFEEHIARLMALALGKLGTAEEILNNTLVEVISKAQDLGSDLAEAGAAPELDSLLEPFGDAAGQALLLPKLIAFLVENGPIEFWVGLFEAIICDLAAAFFSSTSFGRTRRYLKKIFKDPLSGIQDALETSVNDLLSRLDGEVDRMIAPLRAATDNVIEGTKRAMADVFESFDITLLMTPAAHPGGPNVPNLDPLQDFYLRLTAQVNALAEKVKQRITDALTPLLNIGSGGDFFVAIVVAFLVLPILAFLVISLAGGPFSAALLAAVVLIAAEELLHLLVEWLAGPLLKKLTELQQKLSELVGKLQSFFAVQASLVEINNPTEFLRLVASQLRELRDFLPESFLNEAAGVLQEARNVVLRTATQLGLAAEQALGAENASAFEVIRPDYATNLSQAHQLPGGTDPSRLAGAALLRDFGRLEEQRSAIRDGKELEFTHRVSLLRLLGGDPLQFLQQFVQRRELLVSLTERDLIDRMFPGVYRVLIKDIRAIGVLGGTIDPRLHGIPLTVTHRGESRTRIKRSANPFAPPVELPTCFPDKPGIFVQRVLGPALFDQSEPPEPPDDLIGSFVFVDPLQAQIRRIFNTVQVQSPVAYATLHINARFDNFSNLEAQAIAGRSFLQPLLAELPEALGRAAVEKSCGLVDPASLIAGTRALLSKEAIVRMVFTAITRIPPGGDGNSRSDIRPLIRDLAATLRGPFDTTDPTHLRRVAEEAWENGRKAFLRRVARWGDVDFEEDPDPQVRALGFVRLVRRAPPETMVYNLFPPPPATNTRAEPAVGGEDGPPFAPASSLQYRPFENRGIEGDLLVRLESLDDDSLVTGAVVNQLSAQLTDAVLDITVSACYDADLAQTVRSSRRQTAAGFNVAAHIPGALGTIALPDSLPRLEAGASERRSVRFSLRSHRDRTLQVLSAAVLSQASPPAALTALIAGKAMLGRDVPFDPLDPAIANFTLEFNGAPLPNTVAALQSLVGTLRVSPRDLGLDATVLTGRDVVEPAMLVSVGMAVIPMPDGVRPDTDPPSTVDPMNIRLQVSGPLGSVFPGFGTNTPLPERLKMSIPGRSTPVPLADLFSAATPPAITFDLSGAFGPPSIIYDVIVNLTFRVPTLRVKTAINALR
jgi:Fibronectin type III domain